MKSGQGPVQTTCDMDNGGWTLIGETGGYEQSKYADWLRGNVNTNLLAKGTPIEEGQYACIDAVEMAVNDATMVSAMGR